MRPLPRIASLVATNLILLVTFAFAPASVAVAAEAAPLPFAISVSGGVSLGAYQAGFMYYQTQILRTNRKLFRPWFFSGTSAGAVNAVISIMEYCSDSDRRMDESIFWSNWANVSLHSLAPAPKEKMSPIALFSNRQLQQNAEVVAREFRKGLPEWCDAALGVTSTLLHPETIDLSSGISVQRQTMHFVLRIRGRGPGKSPLIENYVDENHNSLSPQLYLDPDPEQRVLQLKNLIIASAAFPAAFDPVPVRFCRSHNDKPCTMENSEVQDFIDGGILDNQPLRLAFQMARQSLKIDASGHASLVDHPQQTRSLLTNSPLENIRIRHVDAGALGYPYAVTQESPNDAHRFLVHLMNFGSGFISSARTRELYSILEEDPLIRTHISSEVAYFPRASDPWAAFFGFFDAGFRRFDFLQGVADAERGIRQLRSKYPHLQPPPESVRLGPLSAELTCVDAFLNPDGLEAKSIPDSCRTPEMQNTRALAQAAWSRLAENCLQKDPTDHERSVFHSCESPWKTKRPEWTDAGYAQLPWRKDTPDQDDGIHLLRLLTQYGYHFDPDEFPSKSDSPEEQVATKIHDLSVSLADRQPADDRDAIEAVTDTLTDQIHYLPPNHAIYVTLGDVSELGFLNRRFGLFSMPGPIRGGAVLQTFRFLDLLRPNQGTFSVAPMLSLEADIAHFKNTAVIKGAIRGGYSFAAGDLWGHDTCMASGHGFLDGCSGWTVQPAIVLTFIERIRFEFVYRMLMAGESSRFSSDPGVQLGFQYPF